MTTPEVVCADGTVFVHGKVVLWVRFGRNPAEEAILLSKQIQDGHVSEVWVVHGAFLRTLLSERFIEAQQGLPIGTIKGVKDKKARPVYQVIPPK